MNKRRTCFVGNSHMACVARAFRQQTEFANTQADFFVAIGGGQPQMTLENGILHASLERVRDNFAASANGKTSITLDDYDAFVVGGAGLAAVRNEFNNPFKDVILSSLDGAPYVPETNIRGRRYISRGCATALIEDALSARPVMEIVRYVATATQKPIAVFPCPRPAETHLDDPDVAIVRQYGAHARAAWTAWSAIESRATRKIIESADARIRYVDQPPETIATPAFTRTAFAGKDAWHANPAYGALILKAVATLL